MKNMPDAYEPHLVIQNHSIPSGQEWSPQSVLWSMIQISAGAGYWMQADATQSVEAGAVILIGPKMRKGALRASQLSGMDVKVLPIDLDRLLGIFTVAEQKSFETAARPQQTLIKFFTPHDDFAVRAKEIFQAPSLSGPAHRLRMLQYFIDAAAPDVSFDGPLPPATQSARSRLEEFLGRTPAADLATLRISDIARATRCGPRHLNRLFHEVFNVSFREKQAELRLRKACELLATTDFKIVDIALESGYQSVSLFSFMFTRRFGISAGRWRQQKKAVPPGRARRSQAKMPAN